MSEVNALVCKNCGGSLLVREGENIAECEFCNTKYFVSGFQLRRFYIKPEIDYNASYDLFKKIMQSEGMEENPYSEFRLIFIPIFRFTGFSIGLSPQKKVVKIERSKSSIPVLSGAMDRDETIFRDVEKVVEKIKVETRVNDDFFEYYFDGSFFLERGFFKEKLFNKIKSNIKQNKFLGFDRKEMEKYGVIFIPPEENKIKESMREENVSVENLYWDNFFYHSEKPEIINYKKRSFFKSFIDKDVELIFYPIYLSMAQDKSNDIFSIIIDGIDGSYYISEIFRFEGKKGSLYPISSIFSLTAGLLSGDGIISLLFKNSGGFFEFFVGMAIFLFGYYLINKGYIKW